MYREELRFGQREARQRSVEYAEVSTQAGTETAQGEAVEGWRPGVGGGGGLIGDKVRVPLGKVEDWLGEEELS